MTDFYILNALAKNNPFWLFPSLIPAQRREFDTTVEQQKIKPRLEARLYQRTQEHVGGRFSPTRATPSTAAVESNLTAEDDNSARREYRKGECISAG